MNLNLEVGNGSKLFKKNSGVSQLVVAVNKMDTVDWSETRYREIVKKLGTFLKQAGFKDSDVSYVPCSGITGENLTKRTVAELSWYTGNSLIQQIGEITTNTNGLDS